MARRTRVGYVYVIHFDAPLAHARHYVGFAEAGFLAVRIEKHIEGNGSRIMEVVRERGIPWRVAKIYSGVTRKFERQIKNEAHTSRHCPACKRQRETVMTTKIFDVTLRLAVQVQEVAEPTDWRWDWAVGRIAGENGTVLKVSQAEVTLDSWIAEKGPSLVLAEGTREHLQSVWDFAQSTGRQERLLRALDRAVFPTFFGRPAKTVLMTEKPYSFYFEIYPRETPWPIAYPVKRGFLMNGGVIYDPEYRKDTEDAPGDWSVHT